MKADELQEELVRFIQAVAEDDALLSWFLDLKKLPENARGIEIQRIAREMRSGREAASLITMTESLRQPQIFQAVSRSLDELRGREET